MEIQEYRYGSSTSIMHQNGASDLRQE